MEVGGPSRRTLVSNISISFSVVILRLLLTVAVAATVVFIHPVCHFFAHTKLGLAIYVLVILTAFIVVWPLQVCAIVLGGRVSCVLAVVFNVALALAVGLTCSFSFGKVLLESVTLSAVGMVLATLYTFWMAFKGYNFQPHLPFLIAVIVSLLLFALIQVFFPLGKIYLTIIGWLMSMLFCGCIVYGANLVIDTDDWSWFRLEPGLYVYVMAILLASITTFCAVVKLLTRPKWLSQSPFTELQPPSHNIHRF